MLADIQSRHVRNMKSLHKPKGIKNMFMLMEKYSSPYLRFPVSNLDMQLICVLTYYIMVSAVLIM